MSEVVWRAVSAVEEADRLAERRERKAKVAAPKITAPSVPEAKCLVIVSPSTMELLLRGRVASR